MLRSEKLKFAVRHVVPPATIVAVTSFFVFSYFPLNFEGFALVYWSLSIVAFPLNYKAKRWTDYVIKHYGPQMEKNPVMREMYEKKNLKDYWIGWLGMYIILFIAYIGGVNARKFLLSPNMPLIFPSAIFGIVLYDFLNDFLHLRKLRKKG